MPSASDEFYLDIWFNNTNNVQLGSNFMSISIVFEPVLFHFNIIYR